MNIKGLLAGALIIGLAGAADAQTLTVSRGARTVTVTAAEFRSLETVRVQVTQHGQAHDFAGVPLALVLTRVGVDVAKPLQAKDLAAAVRITAADGYQIVLALSEIDPATRKGAVILATQDDGKPLVASDGPYRLVVADDLRPARSARQVQRIEVLDLATSTKRASAK